MLRRLISIVFAVTMLAAVFQSHAWGVTIGTAPGTYDFGGLGANNTAGTGYARLGDKFKVSNDLFSVWQNFATELDTIIFPDSVTTLPYTAVIKAEGGTTCKTFTFEDLGISATWGAQRFESLDIVLKDINGIQIGSTISLGSSIVYSATSITKISALYSRAVWSVPGVAAIEVTYTILVDGLPEYASALNFENMTISNVDASPSAPSVFSVLPSSGPTAGWTTVTINGYDLGDATAVKFGGIDALSFTSESASRITAITPFIPAPGTVDITVSAPLGNSAISAADQFTYNNATGTGDGIYDFGSLGGADSAGVGYARLGDKFKVGNDLFTEYRNINTGPITAINPDSNTTELYTAVIKAEGGTTCNTFTFKDLGISATLGSQKFDVLDIVLKDINGGQIGSTISLGSSPVYSKTGVTNISELYSPQPPWAVDGVAAIVISYRISANGIPINAWNLNLENITMANVIGKSNQTITFGPVPAIGVGATGTVSATATSGLPVTFTSMNASACTVSGTSVTVLSAGCIIAADQGGNSGYNAAPQVTQDFGKLNQGITFDPAPGTITVGGTGAVSATATSGLTPITFSSVTPANCSINGTAVTGIKVGTCVIAADQVGDASYNPAPQVTQSFSIGVGNQTISFTAPANKVYGDAPITLAAVATSNLPVSFTLVSGPATLTDGNKLTITGAGSIVVQGAQAGNANYSAAANVPQTITVAAKPLIVTSNNTSRAFSAANPATPGFTAPALVAGDAISGVTYSYAATADATAAVGTTHTITPSVAIFSSGDASNYNITYTAGTLTIAGTAVQSISFPAPPNKIYGDPPMTLTATATSTLPVSFTLVSGPATLSADTLTITGVGSIVVKATQSGDINYSAASDVFQTIVVKANQVITFDNPGTQTFGKSLSLAALASSGLAPTFSSLTSGVCTVTAEGLLAFVTTGTCNIAVNQGGDASYIAAAQIAQLFTVNKASHSISFTVPANKIYGDAPITLAATATSTLPVSFALVSGPATLVGTTLTITGVGSIVVKAIQGGDNNYSSAPNVSQTITVAAKALAVTANNVSRAYGAANPAAPGFTAPALVGSDAISGVTYTYAGTATAAASVGTAHAITPSVAVFSSGNASNYNITYTAGTLTVAGTAVQSISFTAPVSKTYGDSPITLTATATSTLPVSFTLVSGPASLDGGTLTIAGAGSIIVRGTQGGDINYSAAPDVQQTITVAKATPAITWPNPADITYGTVLSATQLNATASTAGTFVYNPASGTTLAAGAGQTLSASFVPTDTTNYNTPVTATAAITVITNLNDAMKAYLIALGLNSQPTVSDLASYDVAPLDANGKPSGNGKIDIGDVVLMLRKVVGLVSW